MTRPRLLVALAITVAACSRREALPFYRTAELTPEWLTVRESRAREMHHVAPFTMTDQHGVSVTERAFEGRATIVTFFFTHCADICPTTTSNIRKLLEAIPDDGRIQVLSYSVTPERDSVAELRRFAERHHIADPRWHFLTGGREATERLARDSYFAPLGDSRNYGVETIEHTESIRLVDARGRLRGVYAAMLPVELLQLKEDLALLIAEQESEAGVVRRTTAGRGGSAVAPRRAPPIEHRAIVNVVSCDYILSCAPLGSGSSRLTSAAR